ncbi:uncharacterized protein EV154DRAFT_520744 [Mucor mucedo]|uniref:uncharacterized protein n=1 Tax=Mucor mucedo TaxID=29922 RepID=UPI002220FAA6|nr:uncharacterized protein EV154DRAFT_520744 [Mucor mucedo]KAI7887261.1 hypothetical protein EV154DRAFT_520744 [Mucor mucedo]
MLVFMAKSSKYNIYKGIGFYFVDYYCETFSLSIIPYRKTIGMLTIFLRFLHLLSFIYISLHKIWG